MSCQNHQNSTNDGMFNIFINEFFGVERVLFWSVVAKYITKFQYKRRFITFVNKNLIYCLFMHIITSKHTGTEITEQEVLYFYTKSLNLLI